MAATRPTSAEWMIHPSFVFKSFDDSIIKPSFPQFSQSSHIVPEKIIESFVDPSGLRCYRVKWFDSWLTEQHISATFPHLITEYWINKPIADSDYQNYGGSVPSRSNAATPQNSQSPIQSIPATNTTVIGVTNGVVITDASGKSIVAQQDDNKTDKTQQPVDDPAQPALVNAPRGSVPQIFNIDGSKLTDQQLQSSQQQQPDDNSALLDKASADFVVESLQLPDRVGLKEEDISEEEGSSPQKECDKPPPVPLLPKPDTNNSVFLLGKAATVYNMSLENEKEKSKQTNANFQKVTPVSVFNQLQHYGQTIQFPPIDPMTVHAQAQQLQAQSMTLELARTLSEKRTMEFAQPEKKTVGKRGPMKKEGKDKQPVACDICGKMISSRKNLRVHKTVRHFKNGSFGCNICGRKFALNRDLQRHMPLHTNERKYKCQYCGLQCKQPGHLTKHLRTHTEVMNWRCDCCFKNFRVQADLKEHCFTEHVDIKDKNLTCSVCKERLKLPNSVYLHSLRHSGVREHECMVCKATFKLKQHLQVHMRTHEKPKSIDPMTCPICDRVFKIKHMFDKHFSKHTETSAEEFKENKRLLAEEKKLKKKNNLKRKQGESLSAVLASDDNSDGSNKAPAAKRKQRKPTKVLYDEDLNTKLVVRRKFQQREEHACSECNDTFFSVALLRSHIKLHRQNEALANEQEQGGGDPTPNQIPMLFSMPDNQATTNPVENNFKTLIAQIDNLETLNNVTQQEMIGSANNVGKDNEIQLVTLNASEIAPAVNEESDGAVRIMFLNNDDVYQNAELLPEEGKHV